MLPVEKGIESFGLKIVDWDIDGDHLGGHKDQAGHNQPKEFYFFILFFIIYFPILFSNFPLS